MCVLDPIKYPLNFVRNASSLSCDLSCNNTPHTSTTINAFCIHPSYIVFLFTLIKYIEASTLLIILSENHHQICRFHLNIILNSLLTGIILNLHRIHCLLIPISSWKSVTQIIFLFFFLTKVTSNRYFRHTLFNKTLFQLQITILHKIDEPH